MILLKYGLIQTRTVGEEAFWKVVWRHRVTWRHRRRHHSI